MRTVIASGVILALMVAAASGSCAALNPNAVCASVATAVCLSAGGACCDQAGLRCADGVNVRNNETVVTCASDDGTAVCPEGHAIAAMLEGPSPTCFRCVADQALGILFDTCTWRTGSSCLEATELAVGVRPGWIKCCVRLVAGCSADATWHSTTSQQACPAGNAVTGVCGVGCRDCINAAAPAVIVHQFCSGRYLWRNESTESACGDFPACPSGSGVRAIERCGRTETRVRCAPLISGRVDPSDCIEVVSQSEAVCPDGRVAAAACAAAVEGGCAGSNAVLRCCRVDVPYEPWPCTARAGWFAVVGNRGHDCPSQTVAGSAINARFREVGTVVSNHGRNALYVVADNRLWLAAPEQVAQGTVTPQSLAFTGTVRSARATSATALVFAEGQSVTTGAVGDSGLRWFKQVVVGIAPDDSGAANIVEGGPVRQRVGQVAAVAVGGSTTYLVVDSAIWEASAQGLTRFAGGGAQTVAGAAPTEFRFTNVSQIVIAADSVFVSDEGAHALVRVTRTSKQVTIPMGVYGSRGNGGCGGPSAGVFIDSPTGIAAHGNYVYVADTGNGCVRRLNWALGVCEDVGQCNGSPVLRSARSIAVGVNLVYAAVGDGVLAMVIADQVEGVGTRTITPVITVSHSRSRDTHSLTVSATGSLTPSPHTPSSTRSLSTSQCTGIAPVAEVRGATTLQASALRRSAHNVTVRILSCHVLSFPLVPPTLVLNGVAHPDGEKASAFGIGHIANMSEFVTVWADDSTIEVELGPAEEYVPTLLETVDVVWPRHAFTPPAMSKMSVTLVLVPSREDIFPALFQDFMFYGVGVSLLSSVLVESPLTAVRGGRLEHLTRLAECPLEDTAEPLAVTVSPVGLPVGKGTYRYHIGAVMVNMGIMGAMCLAAAVSTLAGYVVSSFARDLRTAAAVVHVPSIFIAPVMLLLSPTLSSALKVIYFGQQRAIENGERTLSSFFVLVVLAFVGFSCRLLLQKFRTTAKSTPSTHQWFIFLDGHWSWTDENRSSQQFTARYRAMFRELLPTRSFYFLVELGFTIFFAALDSPSLGTVQSCRIVQLLSVTLFAAYAITLITLRPFQSRPKQLLLSAGALCECAGIATGSLFVDSSMSPIAMAFLSGALGSQILVACVHVVVFALRWSGADRGPNSSDSEPQLSMAMLKSAESAAQASQLEQNARLADATEVEVEAFVARQDPTELAPLSNNPLDYVRQDRLDPFDIPQRDFDLSHLPGYESDSSEESGGSGPAATAAPKAALSAAPTSRYRDEDLMEMI